MTTPHQQAVTNLLIAGHSVPDAAERLGLTKAQVRHAERMAMRRAGASNRAELIRAHGNDVPVPHSNRTHESVQRRVVECRKAGYTLQAIGLLFGLSESGVSRICKRAAEREAVSEANAEAARWLGEDARRAV